MKTSYRLAPTLSAVFLLSGCSALMFETIWFRLASTVLGSSVWSAALVLTAFMSGLALGNLGMARWGSRLRRPLRVYVIAEVIIGIGGVLAVILLVDTIPAVLSLLIDDFSQTPRLHLARFCVAFLFFSIPAIAMGATLPLLTKALCQSTSSYGAAIGRLYGWNTLGAVVGALAAEMLFVKLLGLRNTALLASTFNLASALIVMKAFGAVPPGDSELEDSSVRLSAKEIGVLALPFLTGALLLALEVIWFRYLLLAHVGSSLVFAVMLALVLIGIALGSLITTKLRLDQGRLDAFIVIVPLLAAGSVVLGFYMFHLWFTYDPFILGRSIPYFALAAAILMLPTSLFSGMLFPLLAERLFRSNANNTLSTGALTFANTMGAALGSALAAFILLPMLGVEMSLLYLALAYVLVSLLAVLLSAERPIRLYASGLSVAVIIVLTFPHGSLDFSYRMLGASKFPGSKTIRIKEGLNETIQYLRYEYLGHPSYHRLVTNGYSMSSTEQSAQRYMKLFVYLPYGLRQRFEDVLLISFGVGNTASAMTQIPEVRSIDVVDISRDTIELSSTIYDELGDSPLDDPRVRVHIEDGRFYLQTTNNSYDLITAEPPPPKMAGVVNLYTKEYFDLIHDRLRPGGITTYWLPTHSLYETDTLAITKAFCAVFADCSMWISMGWEFMLMGSNGGIGTPSEELFRRPWETPSTAADLKSIALELPEQIGALFVADHRILAALTEPVQPLTDNYPQRLDPSNVDLKRPSKIYAFLHDVKRRELAFKNSDYIRSLIPPHFADQAQRYFVFEDFFNPTAFTSEQFFAWNELVNMLTDTNLTELPLWIVGSNQIKQEILDRELENGVMKPALRLALASRYLSQRRYSDTVNELALYLSETPAEEVNSHAWHLYLIAGALAEPGAETVSSTGLDLNARISPRFAQWYARRFAASQPTSGDQD